MKAKLPQTNYSTRNQYTHTKNYSFNKFQNSLLSLKESIYSTRQINPVPKKTIKYEQMHTEPAIVSYRTNKMLSSNRNLINSNKDMINRLQTLENEGSGLSEKNVKMVSILPNMESLENNLVSLRNSNVQLKNEYEMKTKSMMHLENENKRIQKEIQNTKFKNEKLSDANSELEKNYKDIETKFINETELLDCEIVRLKKENEAFKHQEAVLTEISKNLHKSKEDYDSIITKMKKTLLILTNKSNKAKEELDELKVNIELQEKENSEKDAQIQELLDINAKLIEDNDNNSAEIEKVISENSSKELIVDKIKKIQTNLEDYSKKIDELYKEIDQKDRMIEKIKAEYEDLNQKLILFNPNEDEERVKTPQEIEKEQLFKGKLEKEQLKNKDLVKNLKELNDLTQQLLSTRQSSKNIYEEEIAKLQEEFESQKEKLSNEKENESKNLEEIINENKKLKEHNQSLINKVAMLPEMEKSFKELIDKNLALKQENLLLANKKQIQDIMDQKGNFVNPQSNNILLDPKDDIIEPEEEIVDQINENME